MTESHGNYHVPPNHDPEPFLVSIWIPLSWFQHASSIELLKVRLHLFGITGFAPDYFSFLEKCSPRNLKRKMIRENRWDPQASLWLGSL